MLVHRCAIPHDSTTNLPVWWFGQVVLRSVALAASLWDVLAVFTTSLRSFLSPTLLENDGTCPTGILSVAHVLSEDRTGQQGSGFMAISIVILGQNWRFLMFNSPKEVNF